MTVTVWETGKSQPRQAGLAKIAAVNAKGRAEVDGALKREPLRRVRCADVRRLPMELVEQVRGPRTEAEEQMFPGLPHAREGMLYANERPGLGICFDEEMAAEFPCDERDLDWTIARLPDGTLWRP